MSGEGADWVRWWAEERTSAVDTPCSGNFGFSSWKYAHWGSDTNAQRPLPQRATNRPVTDHEFHFDCFYCYRKLLRHANIRHLFYRRARLRHFAGNDKLCICGHAQLYPEVPFPACSCLLAAAIDIWSRPGELCGPNTSLIGQPGNFCSQNQTCLQRWHRGACLLNNGGIKARLKTRSGIDGADYGHWAWCGPQTPQTYSWVLSGSLLAARVI